MIRNILNTLKVSVLLFPFVLITLSSAAFSSFHYEKIEKRVIPLNGAEELKIEASRSDITISADPEIENILLSIKRKVKGEDKKKAEELAAMLDVEVIRENGVIKLKTKYPDRKRISGNIFSLIFSFGSDIEMNLEIRVPESIGISVMTASGDIKLSDILADTRISTSSGDIKADNIKGELKIDVSSGDIEAENVGKIVITSASGDISVTKVQGDAGISATSGDVHLNNIVGDIAVTTLSGDIYAKNINGNAIAKGTSGSVDLLGVSGCVEASSASGDIFISAVPSEAKADYDLGASSGSVRLRFKNILRGGFVLKASTTSGDIKLDLPINVSNVSRNNISGVVRNGDSNVIIETSSGDISIEE
ncbi:DUF4097 family beta strand repeat protein [bacterium]|nr:DUF4097 family beta strand repeat protein [bacterium]